MICKFRPLMEGWAGSTLPNIFYSSYISTYLDRDVRRLSAGIDDLKFLGFLRAAATRTGQQANYKGIADDAEN